VTTQRGDTPAYRAAMANPERSGWFRYWLMLAWERRPRERALKDAQALQRAPDPGTPRFNVRGLLRDDDESYWLCNAFRSAVRHSPPDALAEAGLIVTLLRDRLDGTSSPTPDDTDRVAA